MSAKLGLNYIIKGMQEPGDNTFTMLVGRGGEGEEGEENHSPILIERGHRGEGENVDWLLNVKVQVYLRRNPFGHADILPLLRQKL